jgi:hypothetical protein
MAITEEQGPRRHRSTRRAGVLLAALLLSVLSIGASAEDGAEDVDAEELHTDGSGQPADEYGYWFTSPVGTADPSVPDDGMLVMGIPSGPIAVAGLRVTLDDPDAMAASIHLTVDRDTSDAFIEEPLIWACPATEAWEPEQGGDADGAPGETCSPGTAAQGQRVDDEYVFVVSPFIENGELDLLITPGIRGAVPSPLLIQLLNDELLVESIGMGVPWPGPETVDGLDGSNFRISFEAPDGDAVRTGDDSADTAFTELSFDGASEFDGDFDEPGGDDFDTGAGDAGASGQPTMSDPPDTSGGDTSGPSAPSGNGAGMGSAPQPQTADPPQSADTDAPVQDTPPGGDGGEAPVALEQDQAADMGEAEPASFLGADPRLLGALVLGLGALGAGVLALGPQGLAAVGGAPGSATSSDLGGLAQFARPRSGPPPAL